MLENGNYNTYENVFPFGGMSNEQAQAEARMALSDEAPAAMDEAQSFPKHWELGTPDLVYIYNNASGEPIMKNFRWDTEKNGKPSKEFRPYSPIGGKWDWGALKDNRPLYNLDKLSHERSKPVYITEGEKAADALGEIALEAVVTAMFGGAKGFGKTDLSPLKNRDVVIFPDNDETGNDFANGLGDSLLGAGARSVKILNTKAWGTAVPQENSEVAFGERDKCPDKWDAADAVAEGWTAQHFEEISKRIQDSDPSLAPYHFPRGWRFITRGKEILEVTKRKMNEGGRTFEEYAYNPVFSKIEVLGSFSDGDDQSYGSVVKVGNHIMPVYNQHLMSTAGVTEVLSTLAHRGMTTQMQPTRVSNILKNFLMFHPNKTPFMLGKNTGWLSKDVFATPAWAAGIAKGDEFFFDCSAAQASEFEQKGSLSDWNQNVAEACKLHNNLVSAISIALTAPLLKPLGRNGFGVHFYGPSSTGKSTLSHAATSVWGPPSKRNKTWNTTNTALENTASMNNGCLLSLDEINQGQPSAIYSAGYDLANGKGRGRGTANGGTREIKEWELTFMSNGEVPFAEFAKSSSGNDAMAGQETRILDIPVDAGASLGAFNVLPDNLTAPELADKIKQVTGNYHGFAGEAFVNAFVDGRDAAIAAILQYEDDFKEAVKSPTEGADGQVRRVAGQFALVAAAGELAIKYGVIDWPVGTAHKAAVALFERWITARGGIGSSEDAKAIENAVSFLSSFGSSRFAEIKGSEIRYPEAARLIPNLAGWWEPCGDDGKTYWVFSHVFKKHVCDGLDRSQVCSALKESGILITPYSGGKNTTQKGIKGQGRQRCYKITLSG